MENPRLSEIDQVVEVILNMRYTDPIFIAIRKAVFKRIGARGNASPKRKYNQ